MAVTVFSWPTQRFLRQAHIDKCITDHFIHCSSLDCVAPRCAALNVVCACQDGRFQAQTCLVSLVRSGCESDISDSQSVSEVDEEEFQEAESSDVSSESGITQVKM